MSTRRRLDQGSGLGVDPSRNKRGTPMYSREDIREQYCINEKELLALESSKRKPIFGCLSSVAAQPSPCKRKNLLPACLRVRAPSDEHVYSRGVSLHASPTRRATIDYEDESYFKRRPKTICYTDPKRLSSLDDSLASRFNSRPKSELISSSSVNKSHSEDEADVTRRPTQLGFTSGEYHSAEMLQEKPDKHTLSVERSAFTQPNTPDMPHGLRFRQIVPPEQFLDDKIPPKHVSFQKSMSRSATVGTIEDTTDPNLSREDSDKSGSSKSNERLLERQKSPDYYEQKALDQLLAPVLTKALMQEKIKRTYMRTQATQTDAGTVRKSLPHLPSSSGFEKSEMISQGAQTNGEGKRKLVKSLSEATRYEGIDYEIYDLDDIPPLPIPLNRDDGSLLYHHSSCSQEMSFENGRSSESILSDVADRLSSDIPDRSSISSSRDIDGRFAHISPHRTRKSLTKTLSECEILQEKRRALSLASGYIEVDIYDQDTGDEEFIEPKCVDECSLDLSHSRIFSEESLVDDEEDVFHEHLICSQLSRHSSKDRHLSCSSDSDVQKIDSSDYIVEDLLISQTDSLYSETPQTYRRNTDKLENQVSFQESTIVDISPIAENSSPIEIYSLMEGTDHWEESVSESQVTVLQRHLISSGTSLHIASDSENGSYQLTDPSSSATTPSTKHKNLVSEEFFGDIPEKNLLPAALSATPSFSDEQICANEHVISQDSQAVLSCSSSSSTQEIMSSKSKQNKGLSSQSKKSLKYKTQGKNIVATEDLLGISSQEMVLGDAFGAPLKVSDARKLTSPESDSSSSHFTEQDTSRSPGSFGTNTITSRSDLSKSDSHQNTDQSETSEDYVTCTENSNGTGTSENRRSLSIDDRHVSSPPQMEDILEDEITTIRLIPYENADLFSSFGEAREFSDSISTCFDTISDFDISHEATSLDGDTLTSGTCHTDTEDLEKQNADVFTLGKLIDVPSPPTIDEVNYDFVYATDSLTKIENSQSSQFEVSKFETRLAIDHLNKNKDIKTGATRKRHTSGISIQEPRKHSHEEQEVAEDVSNSGGGEVLEKLKLGMKLNFPPGVTMYGETNWMPETQEEGVKTSINSEGKTKKSVKIDMGSKEINDGIKSSSQSQEGKQPDQPGSKRWNEKTRKQSEELPTPGMVRSPAMHDGFRLEDWTPVRTPGTPEDLIDLDSSDESGDGSKHFPKTCPLKKPKETASRTRLTSEKVESTYRDISIKNTVAMTAYELPKSFTRKTDARSFMVERVKAKSVENIDISDSDRGPKRGREGRSRQSPLMIVNSEKERRKSGELSANGWKHSPVGKFRSDDHLLGPRDHLRKADSLRSFSPGSDNVFLGGSIEHLSGSRNQICSHCGERPSSQEALYRAPGLSQVLHDGRPFDRDLQPRSASYRARSEERSSFPKEWGVSTISLEFGDMPRSDCDDDEKGVYTEAYRACSWLYVGPSDELMVWRREALQQSIPPHVRIPGFAYSVYNDDPHHVDYDEECARSGRGSPDGTERDFYRKYQAITHRLVHRKASVEMYRKFIIGIFQCDKTVLVLRDSGEFGFRIHGSRPVVVSAIESDTPAETSGLEVGDIIMAINDINVLDASHSDVVRLAHSGSEALRLDVARTCDVLTPLVTSDPTPICAGYLYKLSGAYHPQGSSSITRKWKRRWFALKKDRCLYYYRAETEQTPLGAVHLLDYNVRALSEGGRQFSFTVAKFGGTTLNLAAHTEESRNRWGQVITQAAIHAGQRDELIEDSIRRVQQSPGAIASPDCFGYLFKLRTRWHQWKRRYCVLKDACLYFYYDTDATQAIGVFHLHGYRAQSTSLGGKKHTFELIPPEPKFRHFYFHADSDNDKKRWLAGFEYSIDRWIKVG